LKISERLNCIITNLYNPRKSIGVAIIIRTYAMKISFRITFRQYVKAYISTRLGAAGFYCF